VILADRHGTGTNGLLLCPPTAIGPSFGMGSRERHAELAHRAGMPWTVEDVPGFAYDVDTADDLAAIDDQR
jgi:2-phospho-L-lactate guanylyltransferase